MVHSVAYGEDGATLFCMANGELAQPESNKSIK